MVEGKELILRKIREAGFEKATKVYWCKKMCCGVCRWIWEKEKPGLKKL